MGSLIAALVMITAAAGVMDGSMYMPFLSAEIVAFQALQDALSLLFAPLLLAAMLFTRHGSRRALVIWAGLLIYFAYYYAFYAFGFVYTIYYPLYLAVIGLGVYSLIGLLAKVDTADFADHVADTMPVRLIACVLGMTLLFVPIWLAMIVQGIRTQQVQPTALVFVLDLPFLIPACVWAAVLIWRRRAFGYVISGPLLFKATVSGVLLTGGELMKIWRGLPPAWDQLSLYIFLGVVGLIGLLRYLYNIRDSGERRQVDHFAAASQEGRT
jgi:hypothetical protein